MPGCYINAAKTNNISEIFLAAHSALESGNGTSTLSSGVVVNNGWFTPEEAISRGAA
ncbi:glucosaminidase domain-containing protein [Lachnotalea glycerini]|uniref:Uncharacterized protein n=1 Tax=Lachnotalea glycerini TaxID=1763509 RepID=A0A371J561_9FIRM|nr:glucosaminidase domain-containing protein [Lachnotalea glycerini]RDY27806.1 hypothetical protein CG710_020195 [Lachnotalea glycerini]